MVWVGGASGICVSHECGDPLRDWCFLKEAPERTLAPSVKWGYSEKSPTQRGPSANSTGTRISPSSSRTLSHKLTVHKLLSLWCSVTAAKWIKAGYNKTAASSLLSSLSLTLLFTWQKPDAWLWAVRWSTLQGKTSNWGPQPNNPWGTGSGQQGCEGTRRPTLRSETRDDCRLMEDTEKEAPSSTTSTFPTHRNCETSIFAVLSH